MCVVIPFIYSGRQTYGRTSRSHTRSRHLPSAVLAFIFLARRIQPFLSLVDREVEFVYPRIIRVTVPRFGLTSQRQKVSRLPTQPPGGDLLVANQKKLLRTMANPSARGPLSREKNNEK